MQKIHVGKTILYESSRYGVEQTVSCVCTVKDIDILVKLKARAIINRDIGEGRNKITEILF